MTLTFSLCVDKSFLCSCCFSSENVPNRNILIQTVTFVQTVAFVVDCAMSVFVVVVVGSDMGAFLIQTVSFIETIAFV